MSLEHDVRRREVAPTHELLALGWSGRQLSRAVHRGELIRVRQGWYATPDLATPLQEAFRVGGRLTCSQAGRLLGLSVRDTPRVHVAVPAHSSRLRRPDNAREPLGPHDAVIHWVADRGRSRLIRDTVDVLADMAYCQPLELTVAAVDSALRLRLIDRGAWLRRCREMPRRLRRLLARVDRRAESITESLVRVRLQGLGIEPRLQVRIVGVGRVDLLIGARLVIEVDGRAYHSDPEAFERDRARDARLSIRGYRVLRFSYRQVMSRWSEVKGSILAAIARGDHLD